MTDFSWLDATTEREWQSQTNGSCFRRIQWTEFCLRSSDASSRRKVLVRFGVWADCHPLYNYSLAWDQPCSQRSDVYICRDSRPHTRPRNHQHHH